MRKQLILGMICIIVVGCGEDKEQQDKVTENMLVGNWNCSYVGYKSVINDGKFTNELDLGDSPIQYAISYKIVEGKLFSVTPKGKEKPIDLQQKPDKIISIYGLNTFWTISFNKESEDKFIIVDDITLDYYKTGATMRESIEKDAPKIKFVTTCERIK